jgi:hypothetical protein
MFHKIIISLDENPFEKLSQSANFEHITTGRKGAILVNIEDSNNIPIVRTTTIYQNRMSQFSPIHHSIINLIKAQAPYVYFNNALIEIYDDSYCNMGLHSDQALDLADNSYIGVFSCYENPNIKSIRKLKIQNKTTKIESEIALEHNSVILFSTDVNTQHLHKIVLENKSETKWLGITFRLSKTYINFLDDIAYINNEQLTLATKQEKGNFYKLRSLENKNINYKYPKITYTINPSDLLPVQ